MISKSSVNQTVVSSEKVQRASGHAPRFSVILCTYNRRNMVLSVLASLRRQTLQYDDFEVIVVDNGSQDGTFNTVYAYVNAGIPQRKQEEQPWHVTCLSEPRNGLAHARNKGLRAASGDIAVFIDDDTLVDPSYLEKLMVAYRETDADAIGGCVELRMEAARPYWLTEDMLEVLGYFAPFNERTPLPEGMSFSNSNFSIKVGALRAIGDFTQLLTRRKQAPTCMEIADVCLRLREKGYSLWYEPEAIVAHRISAARLQRAFFTGRAYWQGRSEILSQVNKEQGHATLTEHDEQTTTRFPFGQTMREIARELREIAYSALIHRPLLLFAGKPQSEQLEAAMEQARAWGRIWQRLHLIEHIPTATDTPAVLLVRPDDKDGGQLLEGLLSQDVRCTPSTAHVPVSWLWRYRAHSGQGGALIHLYRPGAFDLKNHQRQWLWLLLHLAPSLGVRVVTTDAGGWWQSTHNLRSLIRRIFDRQVFSCSDVVFSYTRQPEKLYSKSVLHRVRCLSHPGFRGYYPTLASRDWAQMQLGMSGQISFVYLCLASLHTERELLSLIEAFLEARDIFFHIDTPLPYDQGQRPFAPETLACSGRTPQLLLVGTPKDKKSSTNIMKKTVNNPAIHFFMVPTQDELSLYMSAAHALVIPHFDEVAAGTLEPAMIALSYERVVIAPDLPRFHGMLPPKASILYDAYQRSSLVEALLVAQSQNFMLTEKGKTALNASTGWQRHAQKLLQTYQQLLEDDES